MKSIFNMTVILGVLFLSGCAATQTVTKFDKAPPKTICIAEHDAVRDGVLHAMKDGFLKHGTDTKVIRAIYEEKHDLWVPRVYPNETGDCDAIAFYVANWTWDIAMYMHYANIWITSPSMTENIAQATYRTGGGPDKWINARNKILELVDEMYDPMGLPPSAVGQHSLAAAQQNQATSPTTLDDSDPTLALQKLKSLYENGLISESEYAAEKSEVLEAL